MKSQLFRQFDPSDSDNADFKKMLAATLRIDEQTLMLLLEMLPELFSKNTGQDITKVATEMERRSGLPRVEIQKPLNLATFFVRVMGKHEEIRVESPELWIEDLLSRKIIKRSEAPRFLRFVTALKEKTFPKIEALSKAGEADVGVLPTLAGITTSVELRAVLRKDFELGDDPSKYVPEIEEVRPIVSVSIRLDSGTPSTFAFQSAPQHLEYLISQLQAAQKASRELAKRYTRK